MCGRYTLYHEPSELENYFGTDFPTFAPTYNLAPSQRAPFVFLTPGEERSAGFAQWGLVPYWTKEAGSFKPLINARAETVAGKPSFRQALVRGRCLIPASGYYEWAKQNGAKQPHYFRAQTREPIAFAGIFDVWRDQGNGDRLVSYAVITTEPNAVAAQVHHRMPVILDFDEYDLWLDPLTPLLAVKELLHPPPDALLEEYPVDKRVNTPQNDDPSLIQAVA